MATFYSNKTSNGFTLCLDLNETSYDIYTGTAIVSYKLYLTSGGWDFSQYAIGHEVVVGDTQISYLERGDKQYSLSTNSSLTLASGTATIHHGTGISISASIDMAKVSYTPGDLSLTGTFDTTVYRSGARIKINEEWKSAIPWVKVNGVWKRALPWVKANGLWKRA